MQNKKIKNNEKKVSNKVVYTFVTLMVCLVLIIGVYSYGTSNPPVFGHSAGELEVDAIPSGVVAAFDLAGCPTGWSEFISARGKIIVGAGQGSGLTNRPFSSTGGAKTHTLTIAQMPNHRHPEVGGVRGNPGCPYGGTTIYVSTTYTGYTGGGGAHNNLQPYIALIYCVKN